MRTTLHLSKFEHAKQQCLCSSGLKSCTMVELTTRWWLVDLEMVLKWLLQNCLKPIPSPNAIRVKYGYQRLSYGTSQERYSFNIKPLIPSVLYDHIAGNIVISLMEHLQHSRWESHIYILYWTFYVYFPWGWLVSFYLPLFLCYAGEKNNVTEGLWKSFIDCYRQMKCALLRKDDSYLFFFRNWRLNGISLT